MAEDVLSKYAPSLTADDVFYLFCKLESKFGNKSRAADACGITRRSYYMLRKRNFIEPETKLKILTAAYKSYPDETLDYILQRYSNEALEILSINLSKLFEDAIDESDRMKFKSILTKYNKIKKMYECQIKSKIQQEVMDQTILLKEKAIISEIKWDYEKASIFRTQELKFIIPVILKELSFGRSIDEISQKIDISKELIEIFSIYKREEFNPIYNNEGFVYGKVERSPLDYLLGELPTSASSITPYYRTLRRTKEEEVSQTSTAQATSLVFER